MVLPYEGEPSLYGAEVAEGFVELVTRFGVPFEGHGDGIGRVGDVTAAAF